MSLTRYETDVLGKTAIRVLDPSVFNNDLAVVTVASDGYMPWLTRCLNALRRNSPQSDTLKYDLVVINVGDSEKVRQACQKYGAHNVPADILDGKLNPQTKSVVYSCAKILPHKRFICVDADWLCMHPMNELEQLALSNPFRIGCGFDHFWSSEKLRGKPDHDTLAQACEYIYRARSEEFLRYSPELRNSNVIINDGIMVGMRNSFIEMEYLYREWIRENHAFLSNARSHILNQGILNVVLLRHDLLYVLPESWDVQPQTPFLKVYEVGGKLHFIDPNMPFIVDGKYDYSKVHSEESHVCALHFAGAQGKKKLTGIQAQYD